MPVFFTSWDVDRIACLNLENWLAPALEPADACLHMQYLTFGVSVPGSASARGEVDPVNLQTQRFGGVHDLADVYLATKPLGIAPAGGDLRNKVLPRIFHTTVYQAA